MESRTEKYQEFDIEKFQRSKKNADLYKEVYGNYSDFEDLPIPENTNEIEIENLRSLVESRTSKRKELVEDINVLENEIVMPEKEKVYDINTLLEKAKEDNAKIKKEVTIGKNAPNYLANLESDKNTREIILKFDGDNDDDLPIVKGIQYTTSEISFDGNKVNTSSLSLDILSDLKPSGNTQSIKPVSDNDELIDKEEEKKFYSGKLEFSNADFDDKEEDDFYEENNHEFLKIILIIIGLSAVFIAAYFMLKEYTNLF